MLAEQHTLLAQLISTAVQTTLPDLTPPVAATDVLLERPKVASHGDVACNIAMKLAKSVRRNPRQLAEQVVQALLTQPQAASLIASAEVAGAGFINMCLTAASHQAVLDVIWQQGKQYGHKCNKPDDAAEKILIEFVSANPTGPLHVGHARQAALGDVLSRLLASQGGQVTREFYYNDAGNQIDNLALSVQARARGITPDSPDFPADGYKGDYILDIARDYQQQATVQAADSPPVTASGNLDSLDDIRRFAVAWLRREQDLDLQAFGLTFDNFYLESSLYTDGRVERTVQALTASGHTFETDGALWLRTTALDTGDDKDRVMRKREGGYTYFVPDVAYHAAKWERGFSRAINIQGSDHHGTIARVRAGLQALDIGIPKTWPHYILHKMVKVVRGGAEVKVSKRAGSYITLRELIDWAGQDAVRFFLIQRRADSEFVFDIDLALAKNDENPVYYIQYAHARICSILRQADVTDAQLAQADLSRLRAPSEFALLRRLAEYPAMLALAAQELAAHQVAFWLRECAADFHAWYGAERALVEDATLRAARLRLAHATRQVLANGLGLLGVSTPEKM